MKHRQLYIGFGVAAVITLALAALAFRPLPAFPREEPLVKKLPASLDEWRGK